MTDIRAYIKGKEGDYKEKIRQHRLLKLRFCITVAGIILFIIFALFLYHKLRIYDKYTVKSVVERTESSASVTLNLGTNTVAYSKDGASCLDTNGKKVWNQTYEMQKPMVDVSGECIALTDYNGRDIYVMNSEKILGTISTSMPIKNIAVAENGITAAVLEEGTTTWIYVYDTKGNVLVYSKTKMSNSGYPIEVALSPDANLMAVSYLYVDSGIMRSSVGFYNFGEVGQNELHNYVSGYNYTDSVIPYVKFFDNQSVVAVADDRIMFYEGEQKPAVAGETILSQEILSVYQSDEYVGLVFENTDTEHKYCMDLYNAEGVKKYSIEFDCDYTDIVIKKDIVVVYNKNEWNVYTISGRRKFSGVYESNIQKIVPKGDIKNYMIITEDTMENVTLK